MARAFDRTFDFASYNQAEVVAAIELLTEMTLDLSEVMAGVSKEKQRQFWQSTPQTRALGKLFMELADYLIALDPRRNT